MQEMRIRQEWEEGRQLMMMTMAFNLDEMRAIGMS
jgi:hypothetical protein